MTPKTGLGVWCLYVIQSRGQHNLGKAVLRPPSTTYSCLFTQNTVRSDLIPQKMHTTFWSQVGHFLLESLGKFKLALYSQSSGGWGKQTGEEVTRLALESTGLALFVLCSIE